MSLPYTARQELWTFTSTLGVGSVFATNSADISQFQTISVLTNIASSDIDISIDQSGYGKTPLDINTRWDTRSTFNVPAGIYAQIDTVTAVGQFGRMAITAVNSSIEEVMRIFVYGIPV